MRKIPFAGIELTSQRVRGLRGTSELPGRPVDDYYYYYYGINLNTINNSSSCGGGWFYRGRKEGRKEEGVGDRKLLLNAQLDVADRQADKTLFSKPSGFSTSWNNTTRQ